MPIPNVFTQQFEYDDADPAGYRAGVTMIGTAAGGQDNVVKEFEIPPGESVCPYHYEYEEEWLLLLEGAANLRTPEGERTIERGDLVCFPRGPGGAHRIGPCCAAPTAAPGTTTGRPDRRPARDPGRRGTPAGA